jgi:serine/threonine-protein phosphatase 6 regulatory subunit 3
LGSDCTSIVTEFFKSSSEIRTKTKEEMESDNNDINIEVYSPDKTDSPTSDQSPNSTNNSKQDDNLEYLDYLFSILDSQEMNFTAAGYYAKIVNNLLAKKTTALLTYIYEFRPALLEKMVNHISSKSIAEFLSKLLTFESSVLINVEDETYNRERIKTLNLIIQKLDPKNDHETINNSAYLICEVFGKFNIMHCGHEILMTLLDRVTINHFFEILNTNNATSSCAVALVLGNIFAYYILVGTSKIQQQENEENFMSEYFSQTYSRFELSDDTPIVSAMIENMSSIIHYIANTQGASITNQHGASVVPLGAGRLKLIELLTIAIKSNNRALQAKLAQCEFMETLLELFLRFEWNNMLHNQVEKIIMLVLDGDCDEMKASLFESANILNFIVIAASEPEYKMAGKYGRKIRKGYLGQIFRLSNKIVESKDPFVIQYTENNEMWQEYIESQLAEANLINSIHLGGRNPRARYNYEEENTIDNISLLKKIAMAKNLNKKQQDVKQQQNNQEEEGEVEEEQTLEKEAEDVREEADKNQHDNDDDDDDNEEEDSSESKRKEFYSRFSQVGGVHIVQKPSQDEIEDEIIEESSPIEDDSDWNAIMNDTKGEAEKSTEEVEKAHERSHEEDKKDSKEEEEESSEFSPNVYWKRVDWHSAEDVLQELELI